MFSESALKELEKHVGLEVMASTSYLYFSNFCRARNLDKYADLFWEWSKEELEHAHKMLDYLGNLGRSAGLSISGQIDPEGMGEPGTLKACLERSVSIEKAVGENIMRIHKMALEDGDASLVHFLREFALLVPKEINEKETHLQRVVELGERLADDLLGEFLKKTEGKD